MTVALALADLTPAEVSLGFVFLPPVLVVVVLGAVAAVLVAQLLNRTGLSRFLWHPPVAFLALWTLASSLLALFVLSP